MFAISKVNAKGKVVKVYKHEDVKTPLEALVKLGELGLVKFKTESMLVDLLAQAKQQMQQAKRELFASFAKQKTAGLMHSKVGCGTCKEGAPAAWQGLI